jgi:cellulose synthase/poly-beta-1,6-N-acetylglucosamine synthase-like glycosyltransferase
MAETLQHWRLAVEVLLAATCLAYVAGVLWFRRGICAVQTASATLHAAPAAERPFVSIVIAARDEEESLPAMLDALEDQTYPRDRFEIIVVDDGSVDGTAAIVQERLSSATDQDDTGLQLVSVAADESTVTGGRSPGSKKIALQEGIDAAAGDIILSTDADCRVPPGWVAGLAGEFAPDVGMVVGFSRIGLASEPLDGRGGWEAVDFYNLMLAAMGSAGRGHAMAASGQSLGFRRQAFIEVGGYQSVLHRVSGDDVLLLQLIRRSGDWQIRFCRDAQTTVVHPPSRSWRSLLSQRARWASNAPCQLRLDPVFFAYLGATFLFGLMQVLSPFLLLVGALSAPLLVLVLVCKVAAEWSLLARGMRVFPPPARLRRHYTVWTCLHPLYLLCVGVLGCLGMFSWKGGSFRWGAWSGGQRSLITQPEA